MVKSMDLTGQIFTRWTVQGASHIRNGSKYWNCLCECGNTATVNTSSLNSGGSKSCGCLRKDMESRIKHGGAASVEYNIWAAMKDRCENKNNPNYPSLGGRGIKICAPWHDFEAFRESMGQRPLDDMILTRTDPDGHFEPENCMWAPYGAAQHNDKPRSNNTSGVKGVCAVKNNKFQAKIGVAGKSVFLGTFASLEEAAEKRKWAEDRYW